MSKSLQELLSLKGKTAVVTGGAGYLGTAISETLPIGRQPGDRKPRQGEMPEEMRGNHERKLSEGSCTGT